MGIHTGRQRPFPAVAIVSVLFLLCLFLGQRWIANLFPGISGLVSIDPSLTILDIPVGMPVTLDLILVPGLFILSYLGVILLYPSRSGMSSWREAIQRVWAVFAGVFALLLCTASGALISYLVRDYLPKSIRNGMDSLAINAGIHLPFAGYEAIHLRGNAILLVCFIIGIAIGIQQIKKPLRIRKVARLTPEQQMTPYKRMLRDRRDLKKQKVAEVQMPTRPPARCRNHPVLTIEPEAVNYMPMG